MTSPTTPRRSRSLHWGYALVALTALLVTGGVILWLGDDDPVPEIVNVPPEPAISGLPPSEHLRASSAAGTPPMSNGAVISGQSHRKNPCRRLSVG